MEKRCNLCRVLRQNKKQKWVVKLTHLFLSCTLKIWRLRDICLPFSSAPVWPSTDASKSSISPSLRISLGVPSGTDNFSIFHNRIVASCEPDAKISESSCGAVTLNVRLRTQSSWPERTSECTN